PGEEWTARRPKALEEEHEVATRPAGLRDKVKPVLGSADDRIEDETTTTTTTARKEVIPESTSSCHSISSSDIYT
ncbi:unnamed protein product, partial [Protopolystoma xenopodis]